MRRRVNIASLTCPVCGAAAREYEPWYKPSRGTLAVHLYKHAEELRQRLSNPNDSVIEKLRAEHFKIEASRDPVGPPIKITTVRK